MKRVHRRDRMSGRTPGGRRAVARVKDDPFGVEFAEIDVAAERMTARGGAVGTAPLPYRRDCELETTARSCGRMWA